VPLADLLTSAARGVHSSRIKGFTRIEAVLNQVENFIPVLRLGPSVFVSVPAELSDSQARFLQETVSHRLSKADGVRGLVIDVSALSLIDSFAAKILGETASIASQFGVKAVLVGIRPAVAMTLIELGVDLRQVETALTLERALTKLKIRIVEVE
jgi:rsbT antagonist protein RsbS